MSLKSLTASVGKLFSSVETKSAPATFDAWGLEGFLSPNTYAGPAVTAKSAMRVPVVAACGTTISTQIGTMPAKLYRRLDGSKEAATDHPAHRLVHRSANTWQSAGDLRQQMALDALLHGSGFAWANRASSGNVVELNYIPATAVSIRTNSGEPVYVIAEGGRQRLVPIEDMVHVRAPTSHDGLSGVPPIELAREAISLALVMEQRAARLFGKSERPGGLVEVPKDIGEEAAKKMIAGWAATHGGADNSGRTAFLYEGATFRPLPFSSVDTEFSVIRRETNYEIARSFGVPPTLVGILDRATYANAEQMNGQFYTLCLRPWLAQFKTAYERVLLTEDEREDYLVEFVTDDLLKADTAGRAESYAKYRSMGVMTANEVRAGLNMPAIEGGDILQNPYTTTGASPAKEAA